MGTIQIIYLFVYPRMYVHSMFVFLYISVFCTCPQISVLLRRMLALVDPFTVALEEDLESGPSLTPELDGVTLDNVGIDRFFQEVGQCPRLAMLQGFTSGT